jgi:hypothetical protein
LTAVLVRPVKIIFASAVDLLQPALIYPMPAVYFQFSSGGNSDTLFMENKKKSAV